MVSRCATPFSLIWLVSVVATVAAARAQESPPTAPPQHPVLDAVGQGETPGGVDFNNADAVRKELARVGDLQSRLDPKLPADVERAKLLQRQLAVLGHQNDLLNQRQRLRALEAETTNAALEEARLQQEAARAQLAGFDPSAVIEHLRELADPESVNQIVGKDFEQPLAAARVVAESANTAFETLTAEADSLPRELDAAQNLLAATQAEIDTLRQQLAAPELLDDERTKLVERSIVLEQELVHERMRVALLEQSRALLERRLSLVANRQQAALATEDLEETRLAAARRYLQERLAEAKRAADDEVRRREQELAESQSAHERRFNEEALENSRLAAEVSREEELLSEATQRLAAGSTSFDQARAQRARYLAAYRNERDPEGAATDTVRRTEPRPDGLTIGREIEVLQEQTSYFARQAARAELRELQREAQANAESAAARRTQRIEAMTAWETSDVDWRELASQRRTTLDALVEKTSERLTTVVALLDLEARTFEIRNDVLALLRSENLFLREENKISRDALASGAAGLVAVPGRLIDQLGGLVDWTRDGDHLRSLLTFLAALLPLAIALWIPQHWMTLRIARLRTLDLASLPVRTALLLAHLVRTACVAAFFWLAPLLATTLIHGLPEVSEELLHGLGALLALFWLGIGVNRELLRPDPPARIVLAVDSRTARRVGNGVIFLLWLSLAVFAVEHVLTSLAYRNEGAIAAIDLGYKIVAGVVVMLLLLQRQLLMSLLPAPDRRLGRFLRRLAGLIHPVLVLLVPTVVVLQALGYRILAAFSTRLAVIVLAAFPLGSIAYQAVVFFLERWRERELRQLDGRETDAARIRGLDELARFLVRIAVVLLVGWIVFQFTGTSLASLRRFFDKPLPLQDATDPAARRTWWNVVLALVIAFLAIRSARHVKIALEAVLLPTTRLARSTQYTITTLTVYFVMGLGLWLAINQLIDVQSLGYLVAALSVGIGFGLQEIISNYVSGLILLIERPIKPGDMVQLSDGSVGTVRELGIRATTIQTGDNAHILVPNREFITQRVVNFDAIDPKIRIAVDVDIAYGSDPKRVRETLLEVASHDGRVLKRPAPEVFFTAFADSALQFRLTCWIEDAQQNSRMQSDLRFALEAALKRASIEIPFPRRDVMLRTDQPIRVVVTHPPDGPGA